MQAQFTTKSNRIIRFDVEVSKRQDGLTGPPVTLIVRNMAGYRCDWVAFLKLTGVDEKRAYYRVAHLVSPGNMLVPVKGFEDREKVLKYFR